MDFAGELDSVRTFLDRGGFHVAVIGGVALTAYGNPRLTLDLDIVTDAEAQATLVPFMEAQGFVTLHRSVGYSNHRHAERKRGRVDVMYVRGETADQLFASARELVGPGQDLVDIAYLLGLQGVSRDEARGYFVRAGLEEQWNELVRPR